VIAIRALGVDHLDAVAALEQAAQPQPWTDAALLVELVHDDAVVAGAFDGDDALVGYVAVRRLVDECWILNLATHPTARRRGVAARLMDEAMAHGRAWASSSLWLEVREENVGARALYERCGLVVVGRRPGYYPPLVPGAPREAAILMRRAL
jgi:ribosomal-protein-alanine N-acetyltransferase